MKAIKTNLSAACLLWPATALLMQACAEPVAAPPESETPVAELMGQGEAMVENLCVDCHAIKGKDQSAHPDAPPLRDLSLTIKLEDLRAPLMEGIIVDHPNMPEWAFEPHHVEALLYYLNSLQSDQSAPPSGGED